MDTSVTTPLTFKKIIVATMVLLLIIGWIIHVGRQRVVALRLESYGAKVTFERTVLIGVNFHGSDSTFSNEQMPMLTRLPHLRWLYLDGTQVTDDGLEYVQGLPNLNSLTVRVDQISIERERRLSKRIGVIKLRNIDGRNVVDGFE